MVQSPTALRASAAYDACSVWAWLAAPSETGSHATSSAACPDRRPATVAPRTTAAARAALLMPRAWPKPIRVAATHTPRTSPASVFARIELAARPPEPRLRSLCPPALWAVPSALIFGVWGQSAKRELLAIRMMSGFFVS